MNYVRHFEAACALAERMLRDGGTSTPDRLVFGFKTVLKRRPTDREMVVAEKVLKLHLAQDTINKGESAPDPKFAKLELAAWTLIANLFLNPDKPVATQAHYRNSAVSPAKPPRRSGRMALR